MKEFKFYEYGGFIDQDGEESTSLADLNLTPNELKQLEHISRSLISGQSIFNISRREIKATSYVGVISFGGVHIEVLPKLLRNKNKEDQDKNLKNPPQINTSDSSLLKNLMFMLSYTNTLETSDTGLSDLSKSSNSFIEAYIGIFSKRLLRHLIRYGAPKSYVQKEENLNSIKGKISFSKNLIKNPFDQSKVYCEYSSFTEDNALSRAFKFVAIKLKELTKNSSHISSLNSCIGLLDGVLPMAISEEELNRFSISRREPNLIALLNLTKMFLKKLRPEFSGLKTNKVFSLLFDMNELFEEFIYQVLKRHEAQLQIKVRAQKRKRLVSEERDYIKGNVWEKRALFDTYADIHIIPQTGNTFIIDTKYKIVDSSKSHNGISNSDAYQVLAYKEIYKTKKEDQEGQKDQRDQRAQKTPSVSLLYPKYQEDIHKEFKVSGSNTTFMAWTIDISMDLKANLKTLVQNLDELIQVGALRHKSDDKIV